LISPENLAKLQAFSDGINDYVLNSATLPLEFKIIGVDFHPWTPYDCLVINRLLGYMLTYDWYLEPLRNMLVEAYGEVGKKIIAANKDHQFEEVPILDDSELKDFKIFKIQNETLFDLQSLWKSPKTSTHQHLHGGSHHNLNIPGLDQPQGSNSWAFHGDLTASGKPVLANDPHLDSSMPGPWYGCEYLYSENGQRRAIFGFAQPGLPVVSLHRLKEDFNRKNRLCFLRSDRYVRRYQRFVRRKTQ
jgi:penicillin amidase